MRIENYENQTNFIRKRILFFIHFSQIGISKLVRQIRRHDRKNDGGRKEGQMSLNVFSSYTIPIENLEIDETIVRKATLHLNINGVPIPFTTKQETANG